MRSGRYRVDPRLLCLVCLCGLLGCGLPRWMGGRPQQVFAPDVTKSVLVHHLNENLRTSEKHPELRSWRSGTATIQVTGIQFSLPASIAVQAPRNFRLLVSKPMVGGQEVDIGSNDERFWFWTRENRQILTASHEDIGLALQEMELPAPIHPDWLMEVFGVIPLDADEFDLRSPAQANGTVELVAVRRSPLGEDVERVIRVSLASGRITEHILRQPGGKEIARARLEKYTVVEKGIELPLMIRLQWPAAKVEMALNIGQPQINPPVLTENAGLWQIPRLPGSELVDIGQLARQSHRGAAVSPIYREQQAAAEFTEPAARIELSSAFELDAPEPAAFPREPDPPPQRPRIDASNPHAWAAGP